MRGDTRSLMQHALAYYVISTAWSIFDEIAWANPAYNSITLIFS
jgi:streptomycin 6-kinase